MIMREDKLDLARSIAYTALQNHFAPKQDIYREYRQIREDCRDLLSYTGVCQVYAKFMKMELNRKAVNMAIQLLTKEKQRYLQLRYERKKSLVATSLALHVSVPQLVRWKRSILTQIAKFMLFLLYPEDVFYPERISQMIKLQSEAIAMFTELGVKKNGWLSALISRYGRYQLVMENMGKIMENKNGSIHEQIVALRLANPHATAGFIARSCHVDEGMVSRHLKAYCEEMANYLRQ